MPKALPQAAFRAVSAHSTAKPLSSPDGVDREGADVRMRHVDAESLLFGKSLAHFLLGHRLHLLIDLESTPSDFPHLAYKALAAKSRHLANKDPAACRDRAGISGLSSKGLGAGLRRPIDFACRAPFARTGAGKRRAQPLH